MRLLQAINDKKLNARISHLALLDFLYKQSVFVWIKLKNLQYDIKQTTISICHKYIETEHHYSCWHTSENHLLKIHTYIHKSFIKMMTERTSLQ